MDQRWTDLARTLRELGMWRHLSEQEATTAEQAVVAGAYPFGGKANLDEEPGLQYFLIDGEAMAEGGVTRELAELAPALCAHGIELSVENVRRPLVSDVTGDYIVAINERRCVVLTPADRTALRTWEVATIRPLAVINDVLAETGAVPRLFTLYAGVNEGIAWLLDPRIVAAVADSGLVEERQVPVLATHS